jgi:hypothetical protein
VDGASLTLDCDDRLGCLLCGDGGMTKTDKVALTAVALRVRQAQAEVDEALRAYHAAVGVMEAADQALRDARDSLGIAWMEARTAISGEHDPR